MARTIGAWLAVGAGLLALAAVGRLVARVAVPAGDTTTRRVVAGVSGLAVLLWAVQLAGATGALRPVPTALNPATVAVAVGGAAALGLRHRRSASTPTSTSRTGGRAAGAWLAAAVGLVVVGGQWVSHAVDALQRGMVHPDTVWYHMPFAARFVQTASFTGLDRIGYPSARWFPLNSQLLHSVGILAFGDDALSPLLNLAWGAAAVLVAAAAGPGRGHLTALAAALVLGLPILAGTQPGVASSDVAAAALLLSAVTLLLRSNDLRSAGVVGVAGMALGLAVGTKLTVAAPAVMLVVGVTVLTLRDRRLGTTVRFVLGAASTGSFWFLRNWVLAGSPLPWFDLRLGPFELARSVPPEAPSLAGTLFDGRVWRLLYVPGLEQGLGRLWPLVLAAGLGGAALALVAGSRLERWCGAAGLVAFVAHVFMPLTGGLTFVYNLRYLGPALLLGIVLLVRSLPAGAVRHPAVALGLLAAIVVGASSPHAERTAAWPGDALLPTAGVVAAAVLAGAAWRRGPARARPVVVTVAGVALLATVSAAQARYVDRRYLDAGLATDRVNGYFADVRGARIALAGSEESYPLFGRDLSNAVERPDDPLRPTNGDCRTWRRLLETRYDYVVLTELGFGSQRRPAEAHLASDPAAHEVLRDGDQVVFRLDGPLDPTAC